MGLARRLASVPEDDTREKERSFFMDTMSAFAMGEAHRNDRVRVFDWDAAARRIREVQPEYACAGLRGDWEYTGGEIYRDGAPIPEEDTCVYLASTWATPELDLDGSVEECWTWEDTSPDWDAHTFWPETALTILGVSPQTLLAANWNNSD